MFDQPMFALSLVASLVAGVLAARTWPLRGTAPVAGALTLTLAGVSWWSGVGLLYHAELPLAVQRAAYLVVHLGTVAVVNGLHRVALTVADPSWRLGRRRAALLAVEPLLALVALATNPAHHLFFLSQTLAGDPPVLLNRFGPGYFAHVAYSAVLLGWSLAVLVRKRRSVAPVFRRQITRTIVGSAAPVAAFATSFVAGLRGSNLDLTPLGFLVTGASCSWVLARQGLLRLVPVAREQVVDAVTDAVLVVDVEGLVLDANPAARALVHRLSPGAPAEFVGRPARDVVDPAVLGPAAAPAGGRGGHVLVEVRPGLHLDVREVPLVDRRGHPLGRLLVVRDVSDQEQQRVDLERVNRRLAEQLRVIEGLRADLEEEAVRDALTGLHNRRHAARVLDAELAAAAGGGGALGVVLVDVDHFKQVNDVHGHHAGDLVLQGVARALAECVRPGDTLARWGGEEFVLLLPGADRVRALERADRVRRACGARTARVGGAGLRVTVSAGVASAPGDGREAVVLLQAADRGLYAAKAAGRDRVRAAPDAGHAGAAGTAALVGVHLDVDDDGVVSG